MKNRKEKPLIGIACSYNEKDKRICVNETYFNAVMQSGGIPAALPYVRSGENAAEVIAALDGIIFAGGVDIDPTLYGEERLEKCGEICAVRDFSENLYVKAVLASDMPLLGICRGIQTLNVFSGGSLYQDIPSEKGISVCHEKGNAHEIVINSGSILSEIVNSSPITVNSYHHQAVKAPAKGIIPIAYSHDGIIEAVEFEGRKNALAVQFHPEMSFGDDENSRKIFGWFVTECSGYRKRNNFTI
ncbi:MAG: gamma-glutamyl-gamma-aminobutyrate hydrolase family protein [Victivallales bacterium]|nr:gamma-glutamyl-gamma-aminobutyrate hydrolase family protein [Eubacteriales bacterium]